MLQRFSTEVRAAHGRPRNKKCLVLAALFALALVATPAFADPPEEELTAAPGSIAYGMIEEANANGVFDIVHNGQVSVRHLASGMRCDFDRDGEGGEIVIFGAGPRGDNVACLTADARELIALLATRYPDGRDLSDALAAAEADLLERFTNGRPHVAAETPSAGEAPERRVRHFLAVVNGRRVLLSLALAQANGWTYMVRYAAVVDSEDLREAEGAAGALLNSLLLDLDETN